MLIELETLWSRIRWSAKRSRVCVCRPMNPFITRPVASNLSLSCQC